ncbi:purine and uridine phosphorylase [Trichoderma cornu-damae]|uniref:Purine and uridine phosphorylase n=1 Tax=Trichoderma cornu-damae TaxID=654480 RepID=A0A9P8TSK8_9HYPO|nr:purine and uridine phosphorylase [Trichoderma cornu-damae]
MTPNPHDYTIGWVCALYTEYVAARVVLDKEHEDPDPGVLLPVDTNEYTLGTIGRHNIVIAALTKGEYGTVSVANVATNLLNSFPNVRIALLVGIGGGAPSIQHDIRLGDVVVGTPCDRYCGVVEYDFGKAVQGQSFNHTRLLSEPPAVLRAAVTGVETKYSTNERRLEKAMADILTRSHNLRGKYKRPNTATDKLFKAHIIHKSGGCAEICAKQESNLVKRHERTKNEDNPAIHFGLIASGSQLMNDALVRDKLAAESNILCFETAAAGLMNSFPCLVIRGICDYSDSHKNKEWHQYAALAAAAFARDLIDHLLPNKVNEEGQIRERLPMIGKHTCKTEASIRIAKSRLDKAEDDNIRKWLPGADYRLQQRDTLERRHGGTEGWFLNAPEYHVWLQRISHVLYCPGIPGAGKTVLASAVVADVEDRFKQDATVAVAYIYFSSNQQCSQDLGSLMTSLLKQLSQRAPLLPETLRSLYKTYGKETKKPSRSEILSALRSVTDLFYRTFIIIDGFDKCQASVRSEFLSDFAKPGYWSRVNLCITSRPLPEIKAEIGTRFSYYNHLPIAAHKEDVHRYVDSHISRLQEFVRGDVKLQEKIKTDVSRAAGGVFLLAQLYFESLTDKVSRKELRQALEGIQTNHIPKTQLEILTSAYDSAMERIMGQKEDFRRLAERVLSWIVYAKRQLTLKELQTALAVEVGQPSLGEKEIANDKLLTSACCGLVVVNENEGTVQLVHHTADEYFDRMRYHWFPEQEFYITKVCLTYLSSDKFENGPRRHHDHPLYAYAASQWGHHARRAPNRTKDGASMEELVTTFFESPSRVANMVKHVFPTGMEGLEHIAGIHLAVYFRLGSIIRALVQHGHDPNVQDHVGRTPLSFAAEEGHVGVVMALLYYGANPNIKSTKYECISRRGDQVVREVGRTPLSFAAEEGRLRAVTHLLAHKDILVNSADECHRTPFYWAVRNGHKSVAELLQRHGGSLAPTEDIRILDRCTQPALPVIGNHISCQHPATMWFSGDGEIIEVGKQKQSDGWDYRRRNLTKAHI